MKIKSIKQAKKLAGKVVLLRADLNVPLVKKGKTIRVAEDYKLIATLPTLRFLIKQQAKVILVSHLGRPELTKTGGVKNKKETSLKPVADRLSKLLRQKIKFSNQIVGQTVQNKISLLKEGEILVLENLRFNKGEKKNNAKFAKQLAKLADLYVNNAFAVCHRAHASVAGVKRYLPTYAGLLLEHELENLNKIKQPRKPLMVVIGGVKMETKIAVIKKLSLKADHILLGGALANNFLAAKKIDVGKSLTKPASIKLAKKLMSSKIVMPVDVVVAQGSKHKHIRVKTVTAIGKNDMILDIGPQTMKLYAHYLKKAQTIIWNGPMGLFETKPFHHGTVFIGRVVASRSKGKTFGLIGGGETVQALRLTKMFDDVDWVSTGGGASLTYLGGGKMPGLKKIVK